MKLFKSTVMIISVMVLFSACSKDAAEYNKPAAYWYEKLVASISTGSLDKADGYYSSLQSEHVGSVLLPEATMIMAQAHMEANEYISAEHFLDEYIRRFASFKEREYATFLKIRAKYLALPHPRRDQELIARAIAEAETFRRKYSHSKYIPLVNTMLTKLYMARTNLNMTIALLYERIDKPESAQFYFEKEHVEWIKWEDVEVARSSWYRSMFEGDGSSSWYAYLIPDFKSITAKDADGEDKEDEENTNEDNNTTN